MTTFTVRIKFKKKYNGVFRMQETEVTSKSLAELCQGFGEYAGRYRCTGWKFVRGLDEIFVWPVRNRITLGGYGYNETE